MKNFWKKLKKPILALAPMAGFTDSAFRTICKNYGAEVAYSEIASASALFFHPHTKITGKKATGKNLNSAYKAGDFGVGAGHTKTLELLKFTEKERPYVVQLFGNNPEHFAFAAKLIDSLPLEKGDQEGFEKPCNINKISKSHKYCANSHLLPLLQRGKLIRPDGIDINFGCPAPKVFKTGAGCALMGNKKLAREIISAVCENTKLPVSIKIRSGLKDTTAVEFIKYIKDLPFSAVMIHGRTYEEGFSGPVNFEIAEKIKKIIPDKNNPVH